MMSEKARLTGKRSALILSSLMAALFFDRRGGRSASAGWIFLPADPAGSSAFRGGTSWLCWLVVPVVCWLDFSVPSSMDAAVCSPAPPAE